MNWLLIDPSMVTGPPTSLPADPDRRITGIFEEIHGTAEGGERFGERPDRALLHAGASREDDRVAAEQPEGGEEPEAGAGIFEVQRGGPAVRDIAVTPGDDEPPGYPPRPSRPAPPGPGT